MALVPVEAKNKQEILLSIQTRLLGLRIDFEFSIWFLSFRRTITVSALKLDLSCNDMAYKGSSIWTDTIMDLHIHKIVFPLPSSGAMTQFNCTSGKRRADR